MRVLAISNRYPPWSLGGYEVVAAGVADALRRAGHRVRVLTTVPDPSDLPGPANAQCVHRELRWYWREHRFPNLSPRATVALEIHNRRVLSGHLDDYRPDAVFWWGLGGMSLSLLEQVRRAHIPSLGAVGDDWMVYAPRVDRWTARWRGHWRPAAPFAERLTGIPTSVDLERVARWAFNSRYTLETARGTGLRLDDALIAHPGVDAGLFRFGEPGPWKWRLLYSGRIDPRKGIGTALAALPLLPPSATLSIYGEGQREHRAELERYAQSLGIGERVRFASCDHGDMPGVYAAADAVVFPVNWREPWGLVPLEAMATGRPVLASRAGGGAAEYLRDGRNCLQFDPGDAEGLAGALRRLANDAALRRRLIEAGAATAARFTEAHFHEMLLEAIESVVADGLAARRA